MVANCQTQLTCLDDWKRRFIKGNLNLSILTEYHHQYLDTILEHYDMVGPTNQILHEITFKTEEPIYIKQFKIPDAPREEVEKYVAKWLKMGLIQPAHGTFNSQIFAVAMKTRGIWLVPPASSGSTLHHLHCAWTRAVSMGDHSHGAPWSTCQLPASNGNSSPRPPQCHHPH